MYIQNNLLGINSLNNNKRNMKKLEKSINKLSSGHRINVAADDAAGSSISEKMKGQIRGLQMASRNALDAYSLMETRDGVLEEIHHMMQRMRELTIQSLNDTLTDEDREKLQEEFRALQIAISNFTEESQWNTMPIFETHESSFYTFEGNQNFNQLVKVVEGFNNDLEVSVDGNITNISLDEGYYTIGEIADIIDDKLIVENPNLVLNLTENNSISIQSENSSNIDYISGGLSFLFYEYHIGTPPGMIIGVTEFQENGRLNIIPGHNDKLNFYVGVDKQYTIEFSPKTGGYSIDELIDIINGQLIDKSENDVKAIKHGGKHIALYSDKYVITGLSGNMIKIDDITSVLYDNAKYGSVYKAQASVKGSKDLIDEITITKDINDTLKLKIDNNPKMETIELLEKDETERKYTLDELLAKINAEIEKNNLNIIAEQNGNRLELKSKYYGAGSQIILDYKSNAYEDIFVKKEEITLDPIIIEGAETNATIIGRYVLDHAIDIVSGENDILEIDVDGVTKSIILDSKKYSGEELIYEINTKLGGINATAEILKHPSNGKYALSIKNTKMGEGTISISSNCNSYRPLFCETYAISPNNTRGTTTWPQEGIVGEPIETTPAVLTGKADLSSGVIINEKNDSLSFKIGGNEIEITLDHGSYNADELCTMVSNKLIGKGIEANISDGKYIKFTTKARGEEQFFSNIKGTAYNTILAGTGYREPIIKEGGISTSSITGRTEVGNNFVIDDTNNELSFTYVGEGSEYEINIKLDNSESTNIGFVINNLKNKISSKLQEYQEDGKQKFTSDEISVSIEGQKIKISTKNPGPDYKLKDFSGSFYDNVFQGKTINKIPPSVSYGYSNFAESQLTYIVGREDIHNEEIVIHPHINDVLIFDFYHNSKKETFELRLDPGKYNGDSIVSEIQSKINEELAQKGYEEDMLQAQIGGVESGTAVDDANKLVIKYAPKNDGKNNNGNYIIDGVRGSAAYTVFYKAQGEPSPTHTVGIVDLSNGAIIERGINDTFIMNINGKEKIITLEEGEYSSGELLTTINDKLKEQSLNITASYYEGRLKLSFNEVGYNTIDGIRGNAKGTLFFNIDKREFDKPEYFQIGANSGEAMVFKRSRISTELMRINTITIHKANHANKALGRLDNAINYLSSERSRIGAAQNRLESIIRNNENYEENLTAANSRIKDLDMAKETLEFTKQQILQQATQMILINANHYPEMVLKLLDMH